MEYFHCKIPFISFSDFLTTLLPYHFILYQLCRQLETLPKCCSLQTRSLPIWLCTSSPISRSSSIFNENEETRARFKYKGQYHCKRVGVWASWWEDSISNFHIYQYLCYKLTALIPRFWASFPVPLQCWNHPEWWQRQWWSQGPSSNEWVGEFKYIHRIQEQVCKS